MGGIVAGLVASLAVLSQVGSMPGAGAPRVLSDCDGAIEELVIQYESASAAIVLPVYREFLRAIPRSVTVHVMCPDRAAFEELQQFVNPISCRLNPIRVNHVITSWSRDRWLAVSSASNTTLLRPRGEKGADIWPARAGDEKVAEDIARSLDHVKEFRCGLYFDGGDFVTDGETVFVTPSVADRNIGRTVKDRRELVDALHDSLGKKIVLLKKSPPYHMGMFLMAAGNRTVIVSDPSMGRTLTEGTNIPFAADFTDEAQSIFDSVAERCRAAGRRVVRIPTVPGRDGRTYLTYVNVIIDERDGQRIVYMPVFRGFEKMNMAAADVWRSLGYEVRSIDCTTSYPHFGSLRCLVNVLTRG